MVSPAELHVLFELAPKYGQLFFRFCERFEYMKPAGCIDCATQPVHRSGFLLRFAFADSREDLLGKPNVNLYHVSSKGIVPLPHPVCRLHRGRGSP